MRPLQWMRAVRDSELPRTVVMTAFAIGLRADRYGCCWPTYQTIADDVGCHRRDAMRRVKHLADSGWISIEKRTNGHGQQSNSYLLTVPDSLWKTMWGGDRGPTPLVTGDPPGGDRGPTPQGVTGDPPRRRVVKEVRTTPAPAPVDNPHLRAVISSMSNQHRIPRP